MKTIGIIPARMAASRFPGKPLHPIAGRPMLEHCYLRAGLYERWDELYVATCDTEIQQFCSENNFNCVMTSDQHSRALDRVAEAADILVPQGGDNDIVVCVQGDEPLLGPDAIGAVIEPLKKEPTLNGTLLAVDILDEETYQNPDIVKLVHDKEDNVLYTSRAPIPYSKEFSSEIRAKRVGGIFGFRRKFLDWFTSQEESPLEILEACDSNRICDNGFQQRIALLPQRPYLSVDSPRDIEAVEEVIKQDSLWGRY